MMKHHHHNPDYRAFYRVQQGNALPVFQGQYYQQGHGLGQFFGGLFRTIAPLFMRGAKAVGKQALRTGVGLVGDIARGNNPKQALKRRLNESVDELGQRTTTALHDMIGSGRRPIKRRKQPQLVSSRKQKNIKGRSVRLYATSQRRSRQPVNNIKRRNIIKRRRTVFSDPFG